MLPLFFARPFTSARTEWLIQVGNFLQKLISVDAGKTDQGMAMGRVVLLWVLLCATAQASEMMDRLAALEKDPAKREQAYAAAEERILLCSKCHGKDGNSKRDYIPNLAGQNPQYLFDAFEKYVDGQRTDFVMNQAAKLLTINERVNIALQPAEGRATFRGGAGPGAGGAGRPTLCHRLRHLPWRWGHGARRLPAHRRAIAGLPDPRLAALPGQGPESGRLADAGGGGVAQ